MRVLENSDTNVRWFVMSEFDCYNKDSVTIPYYSSFSHLDHSASAVVGSKEPQTCERMHES